MEHFKIFIKIRQKNLKNTNNNYKDLKDVTNDIKDNKNQFTFIQNVIGPSNG